MHLHLQFPELMCDFPGRVTTVQETIARCVNFPWQNSCEQLPEWLQPCPNVASVVLVFACISTFNFTFSQVIQMQ